MTSFLSQFKLKVSKNNLRQTKNSISDVLGLIKYKVGLIKVKLLRFQKLTMFINSDTEMSVMEKKEKYEEIINKNRYLLDLRNFEDNSPSISIIITNMGDISRLKRLFRNFKEYIQYPSYEILLLVNEITDDSIIFLEDLEKILPLKIIKNLEGDSFSKNNNYAVNRANGEYILLLNSDVEPTYGWLNEMVQTTLKSPNTGAVGAKLVHIDYFDAFYKYYSFGIYQIGITFKKELDGTFGAYNMGEGLEPFCTDCNSENYRIAFSADTLLVKKERYLEVNGLEESFNNGYEILDFCLKLLECGYKNIFSPKAVLFHNTDETSKNNKLNRQINNRTVFNQRWNEYLLENLLMDKINNKKLSTLKPLKIVFTVSENGENASAGDYFTALEFGKALKKFGWEISFLSKKGTKYWYDVEDNVDILISMLDIYDPRRIKCSNNSLIKIAWPRNWFDRWVSNPGFKDYNIILTPSKTALEYVKEKSGKTSFILPIATNPERFNNTVSKRKEYISDYCFTGSYWKYLRDIMEYLEPEEIPYKFKLYGKNWEKNNKFKKYYQGFINYSKMPEVYASTKIVIDDANRATKDYGSVNSRVYDAIASGALVLTNGVNGSEDTFNGKLPVFKSKKELSQLIIYYLSNNNERINKVKELQKFVIEKHTYQNRANTLKEILEQYCRDI